MADIERRFAVQARFQLLLEQVAVPVRHDHLILSLLLCCSVPFVAVRAIATEPLSLLAQTQPATDRKAEADRLINEASQLIGKKQNQAALEKYQQALVIYREVGDREWEGKTLRNIGLVYVQQRQYSKALEIYQQALGVERAIGSRIGENVILSNIGEVYYRLEQYPEALEVWQQALGVERAMGDRDREGKTLYKIGKVYAHLGQYAKGLEYYQQSLSIMQAVGDREWEGDNLAAIGGVYSHQGQYPKALDFLQQAVVIKRAVGDKDGESLALNEFGVVYNELGQYSKALDFFQQALVISRDMGSRIGEQANLANIGLAYVRLGQYPKALESYQQALVINRAMVANGNYEDAKLLTGLGLVYNELGQDAKALESYQQALVINRAVGDKTGEGTTLGNVGSVYLELGQYPKALEFFQQALSLDRAVGNRAGEGVDLDNIGETLKHGKQELAIVFFKQAVNVRESIRQDLKKLSLVDQKAYTETVAYSYRTLAGLLLRQDRILEAQQVLDLLKVQELDDYLRNVRGNGQTARGIENLPPEQQILTKYGELQKSAIQIGEELTDLRKLPEVQRTPTQQQRIAQLVKIQEGINQQFNQFIDSKDVQALVDQLSRTARKQSLDLESLSALKDDLRKAGNAVLLYPLILDDRLELILTTPDSPPIRRTVAVKREELNRTIVEFRSALKNPTSDAKVPAQKLYNWLIKPLEADLKQSGSQTIIYAPDGQLRYIPLAALFDGKQWLVERYRINNITAKSLTNLNIKPPTQPKVLAGAFASGHYSFMVGQTSFTFNGLLGAQKEVQMLVASLPNTTSLIDGKFSRDATTTKMNEYAIVHLATHAAFVTGDPSNSFILFGSGEYATLQDIRNWDLTNVDLIVLSACETGLGGQFGNGEEVLGLGYIFQEKGARAVLASLWTVDDGGTEALMSAFYGQLKQGNVAKVEALRQAQIALINANEKTAGKGKRSSIEIEALNSGIAPDTVNRLSHPYYWAPFILIGNGL